MSEELDKLFITSLQDLKADLKQLDSKFDLMHDTLNKNSVILTEHERRSTASENRLTIVEDKVETVEKRSERVKGFFIISGIIITTLASIAVIMELILKK